MKSLSFEFLEHELALPVQASLKVQQSTSGLSVTAPTIAELVQLDHVAARVIHEDLLEFL
jgi:hypothetical protein